MGRQFIQVGLTLLKPSRIHGLRASGHRNGTLSVQVLYGGEWMTVVENLKDEEEAWKFIQRVQEDIDCTSA